MAPATEATMPTPPTLAQASSLPLTQPIITPDQLTPAFPDSVRHSSSQHGNHSQASSSAVNIAARASHRDSGVGENIMRQTTLDLFPKKPRPETTRLLPKNTCLSTASTNNRTHSTQDQQYNMRTNPCLIPNSSTRGKLNTSASNIAPIFHERQPPSPPSAIQNNANIMSIDDSPPHMTTHMTKVQHLQQPVQFNPYASLRSSSSSMSFTSNPSFSELKTILQSLPSNRALYEQIYGKIITVPCKMNDSGSHENVFNIVKSSQDGGVSSSGVDGSAKKKKDKTKKEKKYEFLVVGKFIGPKLSDGAVACRIDSSLVEPYFNGNPPVSWSRFYTVSSTA